jgi:hypothetical protein
MKDTGINIKKGEKITIKASGTVNIRSYGITTSPDGYTGRSTQYSGVTFGGLMGRIGRNGKLFMVGSNYKVTAAQAGRLYLGVGVRPGYSSTGDFRAKVQVEKK